MLYHNEIEQIFKQNKTEKCFYTHIIYAWFCIEEQTYEHLAYNPKIQQEIGFLKQKARIFV